MTSGPSLQDLSFLSPLSANSVPRSFRSYERLPPSKLSASTGTTGYHPAFKNSRHQSAHGEKVGSMGDGFEIRDVWKGFYLALFFCLYS